MRAVLLAIPALLLVAPGVLGTDAFDVRHQGGCHGVSPEALLTEDCRVELSGPASVRCEGGSCTIAWTATALGEHPPGPLPGGIRFAYRLWRDNAPHTLERDHEYGPEVLGCTAYGTEATVTCTAKVSVTFDLPAETCVWLFGEAVLSQVGSPLLKDLPWYGRPYSAVVQAGPGVCHLDGEITWGYFTIN